MSPKIKTKKYFVFFSSTKTKKKIYFFFRFYSFFTENKRKNDVVRRKESICFGKKHHFFYFGFREKEEDLVDPFVLLDTKGFWAKKQRRTRGRDRSSIERTLRGRKSVRESTQNHSSRHKKEWRTPNKSFGRWNKTRKFGFVDLQGTKEEKKEFFFLCEIMREQITGIGTNECQEKDRNHGKESNSQQSSEQNNGQRRRNGHVPLRRLR
jgi:hypothetical protein